MTNIFHKFIQLSANKPQQTAAFPQFVFMQQDIRRSYKQLKDSKGVPKPSEDFQNYWKQIGKLGRQEQIAVYFRWIQLFQRAFENIIQKQFVDRQGELFIRKSIMSKWQRCQVKLIGLTILVVTKSSKQIQLKNICIRRSKNKQHFSWVMETVMHQKQQKYKSFHLGTNNIMQYQEWYQDIQERIDLARTQHFKEVIRTLKSSEIIQKQKDQTEIKSINLRGSKYRQKTLTQIVMDRQLKDNDDLDELQIIQQKQPIKAQIKSSHPNIFNMLFPKIQLDNFTQNPTNGVLLEIQSKHRCYAVQQNKIKIFITIDHNISNVFLAISESHKNWNSQIDIFSIKNQIKAENSVLIYQKDKSKGFLNRQRDYLFLRHCFEVESSGRLKRIFMIQKSIDSIHTPPFMTVARGQKQLIWCLVGDSQQKECLLVVEGIIRGGGYMNTGNNKQATIKQLKKILVLQGYLQQLNSLKSPKQQKLLFEQNWIVNFRQNQNLQFNSQNDIEKEGQKGNNLKSSSKCINQQQQIKQSYTKQNQQNQFNEFMKHIHQQNAEQSQGKQYELKPSSQDLSQSSYIPPQFANDKTVIIPQNYIKVKHFMQPKNKGKQHLAEIIRGHHLWKGQWAVNESGGLNYIDEMKMKEQKKVLTFIIKRIGKNIFSGKGILNVSLPVDIFCKQSNIERFATSFGYCPIFLEKVAHSIDPMDQLKAIIAYSMGSCLIYLTMEKPFNPILGQTYQCWIDGCPVYFQQLSHHPPIAAYLMKGRGYELSGSMQAKMDISINSGTGINQGIFKVKFDNGRTFYFTTPPGELCGLTYGQRKLCLVDKTYLWNLQEGIFLELTFNPLSKQRGFFGNGGKNLVGEQRLADYFQGIIKFYKPQELKQFLTPKKNDTRREMLIPKGLPSYQIQKEGVKVHGRWTKSVFYGDESIFDISMRYIQAHDEKNPLPSNSNYREDIVYRRLNNFVLSQQFKEVLEVKQRKDRKLRQQLIKKNK